MRALELQLELIQKPHLALRALAVKLAAQLLDLQLQVSDQCFMVGQIGLGIGRFGFGVRRRRLLASGPLRHDHRVSGSKVGGKSVGCRGHT